MKVKEYNYCPEGASYSMAEETFVLYLDEQTGLYSLTYNGNGYGGSMPIESEQAFDNYVLEQTNQG